MEERVRVGVHDHRAVEVQGDSGRIYRPVPGSGGMYDLPPAEARAMLREGGFKPGIGGPAAASKGGHVCNRCGRHNFLPTCGRCEDADTRAWMDKIGIAAAFDERVDGGRLVLPGEEHWERAERQREEAIGEWQNGRTAL